MPTTKTAKQRQSAKREWRKLKREWREFLKSVGYTPSSCKRLQEE